MALLMRVRAASTGWTGGPGLNTFYFGEESSTDPGTPSPDGALLCVNRVRDAWAVGKGIYPTSWSMAISPVVDVLQDTDGELVDSFSVTAPATIVGTSGSGYLPPSTCVLLQLRTLTFADGRKILGRTFMGPVSATIDADGSPNAAALAVGVNTGAALLDIGVTAGPGLRVWRRPRAARTLPTPLSARDGSSALVTSITVPDKYAVLRSRRD